MTDEAIRLIIERLNYGNHDDIILGAIGKDVCWGFVWGETEQGLEPGGRIQTKGYEFFFIKSPDKGFVAAVMRGGSAEMHWYVLEKHRGKGILRRALKGMTLPFIFERYPHDEQEVSVARGKYATKSERLARSVGFKSVSFKDGVRKFVIRRDQVRQFKPVGPVRVTEAEAQRVESEVERVIRPTRMILDSLRVKNLEIEILENLVEEAMYELRAFLWNRVTTEK